MGSLLFRKLGSAFLLTLALSVSAWAIENPLRDPARLVQPKSEEVVRVTSARVLLADYALLRKDFPELLNRTESEIDSWLVEKTAFISKPQAAQVKVNTAIPTSAETVTAYRPKDYGRALVFQADSGLIDAKGAGSLHPWSGDHGNGLASLGESIREFLYERLVHHLFAHNGSGFETVRNYGVIDLGFDIRNAEGSTAPAGLILRQAHRRAPGAYSLITNKHALKIEKLLRPYGVTSAGAHRNKWAHEWLNIQGTDTGAVLDFGGFLAVEKFEKPLVEAFQSLQSNIVGKSNALMTAAEVARLQPNSALRVPLDVWGTTVTGKVDPAFDNPWIWSHQLAESIRKGIATRKDAEQHVRNLMDPVEKKLPLRSACDGALLAEAG